MFVVSISMLNHAMSKVPDPRKLPKIHPLINMTGIEGIETKDAALRYREILPLRL
jgi:hypothetical protein